MTKQIIILDRLSDSDLSFRYALWAQVPAGRRVAIPAATSAFTGATVGEVAALRSGELVELVDQMLFAPGTSLQTMKDALLARWSAFQAQVLTRTQLAKYGTYFDGVTWTSGA